MQRVVVRLALAALVVAVAQAADASINCESLSSCTGDDPQVCGSDGVTYANRCSFESAYCAAPSDEFVIASEGECPRAAATPAPTTTAPPPEPESNASQGGGLEPTPTPTEQGGSSTPEAVTPAPTVSSSPNIPPDSNAGIQSETSNAPATYTPEPAGTPEPAETPVPAETPATPAAEVTLPPTTVEVTLSGTVTTKCNPICTKTYEPVCGANGVTYANQCLFDYAACRDARVMKMHDGKCPKRSSACVPEMCTAIEDPVCGSDGVTYINDCMFHNAKCRLPKLVVLHDGECNEDTPLRCTTLTCPRFTECREDEDGEIAYCADVCAAERCGVSEECQLLDSECFTAPCSPVATCVPIQVEAVS